MIMSLESDMDDTCKIATDLGSKTTTYNRTELLVISAASRCKPTWDEVQCPTGEWDSQLKWDNRNNF